jgi:hypothetical protein
MPFSGSGAGAVQRDVQRALENDDRVSAVDSDRAQTVARRAGASSEGSSGISEAADELNAQLVIQGEVSGSRRRKRFTLTARDATGRQVGEASGAVRGGAAERAVSDLLDSALPRVRSSAPAQTASRDSESEPDEEEAPPGRRSRSRDEEPEEREDEQSSSGGGDVSMHAPTLNIQLGGLGRMRVADVQFVNGGSNGYGQNGGSWYFEIAGRAEVRPFAQNNDALQGLYAHLDFGYAVGLSAREGSDPTAATVSANFFQVLGAVGYLIPILDIFELGGEVGGGIDSFGLSPNASLQSAEYPFVRVAARARLRIFRELLVLGVDGGYRAPLGRGGFSKYGDGGPMFGGDVGGGVSGGIMLTDSIGLTWGLDARYIGYGIAVAGIADAGFEGKSITETGLQIGVWAGVGVW